MTGLSPTAKAILEAYENSPFEYDTAELTWIAAVLRAVVANMSYEDSEGRMFLYSPELIAIATELEASARD
jgi:hypothetical protein